MKKILWVVNELNSNKTDVSPALIWWYGILENLGYQVFYYAYEDYNIEDLYLLVKENKIDYVIIAAYDKIHTELIRLREHCKVFVLQSDDKWRYANFSKFWIPFIDGVITFEGNVKNYLSDGMKPENFHQMRWTFNPNMMSELRYIDANSPSYYISHTGGMHGNRAQGLNDFEKLGVNVYNKKTHTYDETKYIWCKSKYSLCFTNNSLNTGKELKGRVVEIPNWCILVTEPFPDMELYYDVENDIVVFNSVDEAKEKMKYLFKNKEEYKRIFENGKRKLWNSNTAYHEFNKIMLEIDEDYKSIDVIKLLKEKHGEYYYE